MLAARWPLQTVRLCLETLGLAHVVAANGNLNTMSNAATLDDLRQAQCYVKEWRSIQPQAMLRVDQIFVEVETRAALA
jgi:hypothetical protein